MRRNRPSMTASAVACCSYFQMNAPSTASLVDDQWRTWARCVLKASGWRNALFSWFAALPLTHTMYGKRLLSPYQRYPMHLLFRKLWVRACVMRYIDEMASRAGPRAVVIIVGAGLDVLSFYLSEKYTNVDFIEVDHPATQAVKQRALQVARDANNGTGLPENCRLIAMDLTRERLSQVLRDQGVQFLTDQPVLFVLEGLLMYLPEPTVQELMADLAVISPMAQAAFSFLTPWSHSPLRRVAARMAAASLRIWGEPFCWQVTDEQVRERLQDWGWVVHEVSTTALVAQRDFGFSSFDEKVVEPVCFASYRGHALCSASI
ncbi:MAG: class I SAM-dependent methyltransferase [Gammaproteobacteria bacterium]